MSDKELVTLKIDGKEVQVPKGTNLIHAAEAAGVEVPHYCYHPHLSVVGNCRMCQVQVGDNPKLTIACNTVAQEGMEVKTQETSEPVAESQRATLEFLLINHPLDCTVCDQAGHCKLQDYYYEYNAKASRFTENKVHKVKAESFGPEIMFDGERCILCTRCVRFCEEVTETAELGIANRGDNAVIAVHPGKELDNPLSGSVVDLCPVGALTHKRWRFNTRIWYAKEEHTICSGCSTNCSAKVGVRDGQVVQVKARLNADVNEEWMCDEGRYGFNRFLPEKRLIDPLILEQGSFKQASWKEAFSSAKELKGDGVAVFVSSFLTLEEMWTAYQFADKVLGLKADGSEVATQLVRRELSSVEAKLISPDYAPNARAAALCGVQAATAEDWRAQLEARYRALVERVKGGSAERILFIGDLSVRAEDLDSDFRKAVAAAEVSVFIGASGSGEGVESSCKVLLPSRTVHEKNGVFVNANYQAQRLKELMPAPFGTLPEWSIINQLAAAFGVSLLPKEVLDERSLLKHVSAQLPQLGELTFGRLGETGINLAEESSGRGSGTNSQGASA